MRFVNHTENTHNLNEIEFERRNYEEKFLNKNGNYYFNILKCENLKNPSDMATKRRFNIGNKTHCKCKIQINLCFLWFSRHMNESNATNSIEKWLLFVRNYTRNIMDRDRKRSTKIQFGNSISFLVLGIFNLWTLCGGSYAECGRCYYGSLLF